MRWGIVLCAALVGCTDKTSKPRAQPSPVSSDFSLAPDAAPLGLTGVVPLPKYRPGSWQSSIEPVLPPPVAPPTRSPFSRSAAEAALDLVDVNGCAISGGPVGSGRIKIMFAPDGTVQSTAISEPPFAESTVGECISDRFSRVRIPAFIGAPGTIRKGFAVGWSEKPPI